jgi:hypothetical protein
MNVESYTGDKLPIQEFGLGEMCENPSILMIAKRGSGKSWVTKAVLYKFHKIPVGVIISPTEKDNPFFSDFFPNSYIYYKYESHIIKKILIRQKMMLKKSREHRDKGKFVDPRAVVVMDDCLADKGSWARDPPIMDLLFNGRHRQITYILTMQYPLGIKPELRSNFDYVFLLAEDYISNMKKLYDHYAGMFPDFNSFREVFRQLTSDFGAMVIKNRGARANLFDKIAFYKAPDLKDVEVTFGCKQFQKYHNNNYNEEWELNQDKIDYEDYLFEKKKNKARISVKKMYNEDD